MQIKENFNPQTTYYMGNGIDIFNGRNLKISPRAMALIVVLIATIKSMLRKSMTTAVHQILFIHTQIQVHQL